MDSFLSIVYAKINSLTSEKLAVAAIYLSNEMATIQFSNKKIKLLQQLISKDTNIFFQNNFQLFKNKIEDINENLHKNDKKEGIIDEAYFNYLNKYSQGILMFDKPKPINLENKDVNKFLLKFLGEEGKNAELKKPKKKLKKQSLTIQPENLEGLLKSITFLSIYAKNETLHFFKEVDFNKRNYYVIIDLYELKVFKDSLSKKLNKKNIEIHLLSSITTENEINSFIKEIDEFKILLDKKAYNQKIACLEKNNYMKINAASQLFKKPYIWI